MKNGVNRQHSVVTHQERDVISGSTSTMEHSHVMTSQRRIDRDATETPNKHMSHAAAMTSQCCSPMQKLLTLCRRRLASSRKRVDVTATATATAAAAAAAVVNDSQQLGSDWPSEERDMYFAASKTTRRQQTLKLIVIVLIPTVALMVMSLNAFYSSAKSFQVRRPL